MEQMGIVHEEVPVAKYIKGICHPESQLVGDGYILNVHGDPKNVRIIREGKMRGFKPESVTTTSIMRVKTERHVGDIRHTTTRESNEEQCGNPGRLSKR